MIKRCPQCNRAETDASLKFCRIDGATLISESSGLAGEAGTAQLDASPDASEVHTSILPHTTDAVINRGTAPTTVLPPANIPGTTRELSKPRGRNAVVIVALLALVAGVITIGGYFFFTRKSSTAIESIAVLPFENRSGSPDTDYLSDGLAESLIYRLSQLPNLKVSPTSSVMRYKGKGGDLKTISIALGVSAVLTGRIAQRGDNLTISVELVDVRNNKLLWGEQYDRKISELLATQREIATEITQKLQLKLSGEGEQKLAKKYTNNNDAYQLCLKGRYHWNKRDAENFKKAIEQFKAAADKDPNFALAYVGLADCYALLPEYGSTPTSEAMPKAKAYADRALALDGSLGEAHTSLANVHTLLWNWGEADKEYQRESSERQSNPLGVLGDIYAQTGKRSEAAAIIEELKAGYARGQVDGQSIAMVYVGLGDREQAFAWLERNFQSRSSLLPYWLNFPPLDSLRDDLRFKDLNRRMGVSN